MMLGAPKSNRRFKRLLRLITRRYKSFKSEVAKRPPSNCTIGRSSGGITGRTSKIIQDGSFPELRNASNTSRRLIARVRRCPCAVLILLLRSLLLYLNRYLVVAFNRFCTHSDLECATISITICTVFFSESNCFLSSGVSPLSVTT